MVVVYSMWGVNFFKKSNFLYLINQVQEVRNHKLQTIDMFYIVLATSVYWVLIIYTNYGMFFQYIVKEPDKPVIDAAITIWTINVSWNLILNSALTICFICIVLSREYKECLCELQNNIIIANGNITDDIFLEVVERFRKLGNVVHGVDAMLSAILSLVLSSTMMMLCAAIYVILEGQSIFGLAFSMAVSAFSTMIILPTTTSLHHTVSFQAFILNAYLACVNGEIENSISQ